jgi:6-hydroxytryprostatin B O-methyltransferase
LQLKKSLAKASTTKVTTSANMTMNLREYAAHVSAHAEKLQSYLDSHDEKLGFEADARPSRQFPQDLQESRIALMSACLDMYDLIEGPESMMTTLPFLAVHDIGALKMLYHYQLWKLVPTQGTISYTEMAKSLNLEVHRLTAYVRQLITRRIFCEPEPNRIAHSAASLLVAQNEGLRSWIAMCTDDVLEAVQAYPETYDAHGLSLDPKLTPYNIARKNTSVNSMALVLSDKERGPRYSKALGWFAKTEMGSNEAILDAYPWDKFELVVDVTKTASDFFSLCLSLLTYGR